jgi:hypothetical protein|nr:MAG TPA: hypothetical protein [Caudoviricetes sp.]
MLNIEYYKELLVKLGIINLDKLALVQGQPHICDDTKCTECLFIHTFSCSDEALNWLLTEYKEPEVDWSKVKVDTPILVRKNEDKEWVNRYFAKFEDGKVYAWMCGATSWTVDDEYDVTFWKYAKLAESEVLK